jgi:cell division protein FtsL
MMAEPRRGIAVPSEPAHGQAEPPSCTPTRFYAYWIFALAAVVSAFASHIYVRQRIVDLGYQLGQERAHRAALENERRDLELELASLEAPADLAQLSRDVLGLDVPRDDQMIEVAAAGSSGPGPRTPTQVVVPSEPADPSTVAAPPPGASSFPIDIGPAAPLSGPGPAPEPAAPARRHRPRRAQPAPAPAPEPAPAVPEPALSDVEGPASVADGRQPTADSQQPAARAADLGLQASGPDQQPTANSLQPSPEVAP